MLKDQRILALDIGASSVRLAEFEARKEGGVQLLRFGVAPLEADQQSDADRLPQLTAAIRDLMRENGIKPGPVILSVSGQSVFSRFVKLPSVDKDKIEKIIAYEAQQNVPFPIDEVVWDYQLIGRGEGELDVMLAAIKAEIIVGLTDAVEQAGLITDIVDVAPMALYNAVRYNYSDLTGCALVIDIGARSTDLIFIEEGRVFIRSVPVAGNAMTQQIMREFELSFQDAEEMKRAHSFVAFGGAYEAPPSEVADKVSKIVRNVMTRLHAEIDRSIKFYRSQQNGLQPSLVLLTGGASVIPYSDAFLKDKLKVDVDYLNPFINVPVSQSISAEEIGKNAHLLGQLVGLALRKVLTCPIEINLLPPKVVADKSFRRKEPLLVMAGVCVALTLFVWSAFNHKVDALAREKYAQVQEKVTALEQQEAPLRESENRMDEVGGKATQLAGLPARRSEWMRILGEIQKCLPQNLWLSSVTPVRAVAPDQSRADAQPLPEGVDPGDVIAIDIAGLGYIDRVASSDEIRAFRDVLRANESFSEKTEILLQPSPAETAFVREFSMRLELEKPLGL